MTREARGVALRLRFSEFADEPPWEYLPLRKIAKRIA